MAKYRKLGRTSNQRKALLRNQVTNQYEVVEHTKTNRDRFVVLVPKAINILQKIERTGDYIFMRDSERLTSRQIAYVLEKYAERQGLSTKSTHKMRKTFASNLNASGVPLDCIRELLGHSNLNTTLGYIYNPLTEKETYVLEQVYYWGYTAAELAPGMGTSKQNVNQIKLRALGKLRRQWETEK